MSDTDLNLRIGYIFILCYVTFFATRYGKVLWHLLTRGKSNGVPFPKSPLDTRNDTMSRRDSSVAATQRAYDEVHVLLISWDGVDACFYKELVELRKVFRDSYNFDEGDSDIEEFSIPSEDSKSALDDKLSQFLQKDGP